MKKSLTFSIGIPAYNEEKRIVPLLHQLLEKQVYGTYRLLKILVYSDGSEDNTVAKIKELNNQNIIVHEGKKRLGKTHRLQQMFQDFKGDYIVMVDADVVLKNAYVILNLLKAFKENTGLVCGNSRPTEPQNFVERSVYTTFQVFDASRSYHNQGHNLFCCGATMALTKEFAKQVKMPPIINEDAYLYLLCKKIGFGFQYAPKAVAYYKLPSNFKDYIKQLVRSEPIAVAAELGPYFPDTIASELNRNKIWYIKQVLNVFCQRPLEVTTIMVINLLLRPVLSKVILRYNLNWFTAASTHNL